MASTTETALFDFMVVRPPDSVSLTVLRRRYIRDGPEPQIGRDLEEERARTSLADISELARLVYDRVLCDPPPADRSAATELLLNELIAALPSYLPERAGSETPGLPLGALERHAWVSYEGRYFLLPDRVEDLVDCDAYVPTRAGTPGRRPGFLTARWPVPRRTTTRSRWWRCSSTAPRWRWS